MYIHTKFNPDWYFGIWKVKWRSSTANTMNKSAATVRRSPHIGHDIPQLVSDLQKPVVFGDWKSYLQRYFRLIENIRSYRYFWVKTVTTGVVECKEFCNSVPISVNLLKDRNIIRSIYDPLPQDILAPDFVPRRRGYLFEEIPEHCRSPTSKDTSCPTPAVPKKRWQSIISLSHRTWEKGNVYSLNDRWYIIM